MPPPARTKVRPFQLSHAVYCPLSREGIWVRLRGPFLLPEGPVGHACDWERFDADRAGCLLCGTIHKCSQGMVVNTCPVEETDDSAHVCLITGLTIPEVRSSKNEYSENVVVKNPGQARVRGGSSNKHIDKQQNDRFINDKQNPGKGNNRSAKRLKTSRALRASFRALASQPQVISHLSHPVSQQPCPIHFVERAHGVIHSFFAGAAARRCKRLEEAKATHRLKQTLLRVVKRYKQVRPGFLPNVVDLVADMAREDALARTMMRKEEELSEGLIDLCADAIGGCLRQLHGMGLRKLMQASKWNNVVIGLMYLMRKGMRIYMEQRRSWFVLPREERLVRLLPAETYLSTMGVSNKIICDTENEIKNCLRRA